ncbi:hypothetical protein [Arthrobacter sp. Z1-15]
MLEELDAAREVHGHHSNLVIAVTEQEKPFWPPSSAMPADLCMEANAVAGPTIPLTTDRVRLKRLSTRPEVAES